MMVFSMDESTNNVVLYAGVPEKRGKGKLDAVDWLSNALRPLEGRCGKGKCGSRMRPNVHLNRWFHRTALSLEVSNLRVGQFP